MDSRDDHLDRALREALRDDDPVGAHPDPDVLLAYHARDLSRSEAEAVLRHLADCPSCAGVILDFEEFPRLEPPTEEHRLTPDEKRWMWRGLKRDIEASRRPPWRRHEVLLPLAASLLVAVVALGVWVSTLESELDDARVPRGDAVMTVLQPLAERSRGSGGEARIPPGTGPVVLVLPFSSLDRSDVGYRLEVRDSAARVVIEDLEVVPGEEGFVITLPRELLAPGPNLLEIFDAAGRPLARYRVLSDG